MNCRHTQALLSIGAICTGLALAQAPPATDGVEVLQLRPNLFMIAGSGGNVAVQVGDLGGVLVDTGSAQKADRLLAEIKNLTKLPVRYIINTSADPDHVGGNEQMSKGGLSLIPNGGGIGAGIASAVANGGGAAILATENVLARMSAPTGTKSPYPTAAWPSDTFSDDEKDTFLNGEGIQVFFQRAAHTDGDTIVFFRRSDVVVAGDFRTGHEVLLQDLRESMRVTVVSLSGDFIREPKPALAVPTGWPVP